MKVAVSSLGSDMNSPVDPRFGRAQYFLIVDIETMEFEAILNPNIDAPGGAAIQSAQLIGNKGIEAVITGQVGPNAFQTLSAIGVRIYHTIGGTVRQTVELYKAGQLRFASQPGPGHAGVFWGGGRYSGRGSASRGRRRSMGGEFGDWQRATGLWGSLTQFETPQKSKEQEIQTLKQQAEMLGKQMEEIHRRLQELEVKKKDKE